MASVRRLLRADSDGWGVSGTIGLVLSISCVSFSSWCPLRSISKCFITQWHVGRRSRWKSRRWAEQIKLFVLERLKTKSKHQGGTHLCFVDMAMHVYTSARLKCRCQPIKLVQGCKAAVVWYLENS